MGKRRVRLLQDIGGNILFGIDSNEERRKEATEKYGIKCYECIKSALIANKIDAAIISTSPLSHSAIIKECLQNGLHVFTEINLVDDGYEENIKLSKEKGKVLFLSSTFLYQDDIAEIISRVKHGNGKVDYIYHVGQYLPDWHPWESYKNYFIGDIRTNGCREIMAIELPWIVSCFGNVSSAVVRKSINTSLDINYNDNYIIILEHETGAKGVFAVDVVSRDAVRDLIIYSEDLHLTWKGSIDSLSVYNIKEQKNENIKFDVVAEHAEGYASFIDEVPYREELIAFLRQIQDSSFKPVWDFEKDSSVIKLINEIESNE